MPVATIELPMHKLKFLVRTLVHQQFKHNVVVNWIVGEEFSSVAVTTEPIRVRRSDQLEHGGIGDIVE